MKRTSKLPEGVSARTCPEGNWHWYDKDRASPNNPKGYVGPAPAWWISPEEAGPGLPGNREGRAKEKVRAMRWR